MKFNEETFSKYNRGPCIKKIIAEKVGLRIEPLDIEAVNRVNQKALVSIRQHEIECCKSNSLANEIIIGNTIFQ